jgi:hypothetical protein
MAIFVSGRVYFSDKSSLRHLNIGCRKSESNDGGDRETPC